MRSTAEKAHDIKDYASKSSNIASFADLFRSSIPLFA